VPYLNDDMCLSLLDVPCISDRQVALLDGAQVEMECLPDDSVSREQLIARSLMSS
jgi:hypothetical protein